jgi:two-component system chemotaxis response regulator CheB
MRKLKVLVADPSVVLRRELTEALAEEPQFDVVAAAANARIALAKMPQVAPDALVISADADDGAGTAIFAELRAASPRLPVLLVHPPDLAPPDGLKRILSTGPLDDVQRPSPADGKMLSEKTREEIRRKLRLLAGITKAAPPVRTADSPLVGPVELLAIGASTGGPNALAALMTDLPGDLPVPIVIVQHMPPFFTRLLAERLTATSAIQVREAVAGDVLEPGNAWIAPGDFHMVVAREAGKLRVQLHQGPHENSCRPAVDVLFRSAADVCGAAVLSLVLTGMGQDGLRGAGDICGVGGQVLVQDEASSVVWGMPGFIAKAGLAHAVLPLDQIAAELVRRLARSGGARGYTPAARPASPLSTAVSAPLAAPLAAGSRPHRPATMPAVQGWTLASAASPPAAAPAMAVAAPAKPAAPAAPAAWKPVATAPAPAPAGRFAPAIASAGFVAAAAMPFAAASPAVAATTALSSPATQVRPAAPPQVATLQGTDVDFLRDFIYRRSAIVIEPGKEYLLESRLATIAREEGVGSVQELVARLRSGASSEVQARVIEAMTTNETTFFRDVHPFEAFATQVAPALARARSAERKLTIWCAASSTGQEPYSIAMVLKKRVPDLASFQIRILATDLSTAVLDRAREGRYRQLEVNRGLPAPYLVEYFRRDGNDWVLKDEIRRMVEFRQLNLVEPWPPLPTADVVFIRNVLIYFDVETKRGILQKIKKVLASDAYLFLGGAETTMNLDDSFQRVQVDRAVYYRLVDGRIP